MEPAKGNYCSETFVFPGSGRLIGKGSNHVFYTDGAVDGNGKADAVGGCAYYSGENCKSSWKVPYGPAPDGSRYKYPVTNQNAELLAVLGALQRAYWDGFIGVLIRTDSQ